MDQVNKGLPAGPDRAATHSGRPLPENLAADSNAQDPDESGAAGSSAKTKAKEATTAATRQAKQVLQEGAQQLRGTANGVVDQAATDVGRQLSETATAVRNSLSPLRERQPKLASLADQSISKLEQTALDIERQDLESVIAATTEFAHRRPELFIGGAALAGLALGRFIQLAVESE